MPKGSRKGGQHDVEERKPKCDTMSHIKACAKAQCAATKRELAFRQDMCGSRQKNSNEQPRAVNLNE